MLVARYFLYVGGALLALLFAIDALVPQDAATETHSASAGVDKSTVRIHSVQKLPERVVYDTSLPTMVPPVSTTQLATAPAPPAPQVSSAADAGQSFAQLVPAEAKKQARHVDPQARKRRIAKLRGVPPGGPGPVRVAQQAHFGFFGGGPFWSTW
jgi:hypothetical protein